MSDLAPETSSLEPDATADNVVRLAWSHPSLQLSDLRDAEVNPGAVALA